MEYSLRKIFLISFGISLTTLLFLLILIFDALFLDQRLEKKLKNRLFDQHTLDLKGLSGSFKKKLSTAIRWDEDE